MSRPKQSMAQRLMAAQVAIDNSLNNPAILNAVTAFGYDAARLQAGRDLYDEVMALTATQEVEYGEQYEATAVVNTAWETADLAYKKALKISRVVFRGNQKARNALGLSGSRKKTLSGWIKQATTFYTNLLNTPDLIAAMTPYSYDQTKLEAEAALVQAVVAANAAQDKERGEAQEATQMRDVKMDELDQWVADYKAVAQVALSDSPQMLEQLGWVVPS
ncbi:MAG: hypothetical protein H6667_20345 [Ardenticatenaceae bacterium]|nr:hypothetical protein [Ardenticatenaceae bacterium]